MLEWVSPDGGEDWAAGSRRYILWEAQAGADQTPRAEYTVDDGEHWANVPALAAGAGRILWPVPDRPSRHCRVRVFDRRSGASGESPTFTIVPSQEAAYEWEQATAQGPFAPRDGAGALVNASRSIIYAYERPQYREQYGNDWKRGVEQAVLDAKVEMSEALPRMI